MENDAGETSKGVRILICTNTYEKLKEIASRKGLTIEKAIMMATHHFMNTKMKEPETEH